MRVEYTEYPERSVASLLSGITLTTALAVVNFYLFYIGFINSDDGIYVNQARRLMEEGAYLPTSHWGFRYTILLPIVALENAVDSPGEWHYSLIPLAFSLALCFAVVFFLWLYVGNKAALIAGILSSTLPLLVTYSSIVNPDIAEAFFLFMSLFLYYAAMNSKLGSSRLLMAIAGVLLGLALITRETAYGFILVFGLFFLFGVFHRRSLYLWPALGLILLLGIEWSYYLIQGESTLYRFMTIAESHGTLGRNPAEFAHLYGGTGNITDHRWLAPPMALLVNQEFAALFFAAFFAGFMLFREKIMTAPDKRILWMFGTAALIFFIWLGYGGAIRPLTRYFAFVAIVAIIPIAIFVQRTRWRVLAIAVPAMLVTTNYLALSVSNIHPRFEARPVVELALADQIPVVTDPKTVSRSVQRMNYERIQGKELIRSEVPENSSFYLALVDGQSPKNRQLAEQARTSNESDKIEFVRRIAPPKLYIAYLLDRTPLVDIFGESRYRWLTVRNPGIDIYYFQQDVQ